MKENLLNNVRKKVMVWMALASMYNRQNEMRAV